MAYQARVLYDFEAASPGELPVKEGDLVTVTLPDVGQGWSQAKDSSGQEGVVPEAYLERAGAPSAGASPPAAPPPAVAPSLSQSQASSFGWDDDKWDSDEEEHRYEDPADLQAPAPKGPGIDYGPVKVRHYTSLYYTALYLTALSCTALPRASKQARTL